MRTPVSGRPSETDIPAITVHSGMQYFNQSQARAFPGDDESIVIDLGILG